MNRPKFLAPFSALASVYEVGNASANINEPDLYLARLKLEATYVDSALEI